MKLRLCPDCGASLDPEEKCDCTKKEAVPVPGDKPQKEPTAYSLAPKSSSVNPEIVELADLVFPDKVMDKDIVAAIQGVHCKYDKTLHSKCKRGTEYGIQLRRSAIDAVTLKLGAVAHTAPKPRKSDNRSLPCRISCRLLDGEFSELQQYIRDDGHDTMQDFLLHQIRQYIKRKKKSKK